MKCPICDFPELKTDDKACPQCQSDLEVFSLIEKSKKIIKKKHFLMILFLLCLIISVIANIYIANKAKKDIDNKNIEIAELITEKEKIFDAYREIDLNNKTPKKKIELDEEKIIEDFEQDEYTETDEYAEADTYTESGTYTEYIIKSGDNLWEIAVKFYNDGSKFQKIAEDNDIDTPETIVEGEKLKIYQ